MCTHAGTGMLHTTTDVGNRARGVRITERYPSVVRSIIRHLAIVSMKPHIWGNSLQRTHTWLWVHLGGLIPKNERACWHPHPGTHTQGNTSAWRVSTWLWVLGTERGVRPN